MPPTRSLTQAVSTQNTTYSDNDDDNNNEETYEDDPNMKQMISASIQYILIHSSKAQVIKRLDWTNLVLRPLSGNARKCFPTVHKQVMKILHDTFGYRLVTLDKNDGRTSNLILFNHFFCSILS